MADFEDGADGATQTTRLRRLQTAMAEAETALARRLAVGPTDLAAMTHLTFAGDPIGPRELSGRLGITPGATTELVDRLERAGHLERRRDTVDRRRVQLHPSAPTLDLVGRELHPLLAALDRISAELDDHDRAVVDRYLDDVLAAYRSFASDPSATSPEPAPELRLPPAPVGEVR